MSLFNRSSETHSGNLLKLDHERMNRLFRGYEAAESPTERAQVAAEICEVLWADTRSQYSRLHPQALDARLNAFKVPAGQQAGDAANERGPERDCANEELEAIGLQMLQMKGRLERGGFMVAMLRPEARSLLAVSADRVSARRR